MRSLLTLGIVFYSMISAAHESHQEKSTQDTAHLEFAQGRTHAHITWEKGPQLGEESSFRVEWKDGSDHSPIQPRKAFEVVLWMPDMGHGSAPTLIEPILSAEGSPLTGVYRVSSLYFLMGGLWHVNVILEGEDGSKETRTLEIQIQEGHHHGHHHH